MDFMETYDYYWNQQADPRTNDMLLFSSPIIVPITIIVYLYVIYKWGPEYMKDRKPYSLKTYAKCYNIFQIISNAYVVYSLIDAGWFTEISVFCELPDYSYNRGPLKVAMAMRFGAIIRYIDLSETVVFVLRKKNSQVSILHVYHHVSTLLICWLYVRYLAIPMASFCAIVNCTVHVIMYTYYFLSTFGPKTRKVIQKFKPLLTITQMTQLVILLLHTVQSLLPYCKVPRSGGIIFMVHVGINLILFYDFYQNTYVKADGKKKK